MIDPDRKLIRKARRGDRRALAALYDRHRRSLFGFLVNSAGERAAAEDLFQEVWLKVLRGLGGYDPERGGFRPWLFRIAANAVVDRARRERVRQAVPLETPAENPDRSPLERIADDRPDPETRSVARQAGAAVAAALCRLDNGQRTAVLLRHQQGLTYPELAAAMGVPEGTAKSLVHRGVRKLRDRLKDWRE